jgi:hypothetical protein
MPASSPSSDRGCLIDYSVVLALVLECQFENRQERHGRSAGGLLRRFSTDNHRVSFRMADGQALKANTM